MNRVDLMYDIETLGKIPGSIVLSIGACIFDPMTGRIGETFYVNIDAATCYGVGLTDDPETLEWWGRPERAEARKRLESDQMRLWHALSCFTAFCQGHGVTHWWANDPDFDKVLLEAAYRAVGQDAPWPYWAGRSCRTIYDLAGVKPDRSVGIHHDGLDDAKAQAVAVAKAHRKLGLIRTTWRTWVAWALVLAGLWSVSGWVAEALDWLVFGLLAGVLG